MGDIQELLPYQATIPLLTKKQKSEKWKFAQVMATGKQNSSSSDGQGNF